MMLTTAQKKRMKYIDRIRRRMELKVSVEESRQPFRGKEKLSQSRELIHRASIGSSVLMVKRSHETRQSIPLSPRTAEATPVVTES